MSRTHSRWTKALAALFGTAILFQVPQGACLSFGGEQTATAVNWCWIIDCQNGIGGGLILPCGDPTTAADDLLADCPAPVSGDTGTDTTTTDTTTDTTG
jgi:hypothetical protein